MDDNRLPKKIKLWTWREKKYRKTTNETGGLFPGGRNRPKGLSLIVDDDKIKYILYILSPKMYSMNCPE